MKSTLENIIDSNYSVSKIKRPPTTGPVKHLAFRAFLFYSVERLLNPARFESCLDIAEGVQTSA